MYKILIVDDEPLIRQGLKKKIQWTSFGFEIIAEAKNGLEALELTKSINFDVIIADMKMPKMDGVELLKALKENKINTKIIVISAYSDFYYTHNTIRFGAFDYILKPIDAEELTTVILNLKKVLDLEHQSLLSEVGSTSIEPIFHAKNNFLKNFSPAYLLDKTGVTPQILDLDMALIYNHYVCLVIYTKDDINSRFFDMVMNTSQKMAEINRFVSSVFKNPIYAHHIFIIWGFSEELTASLPALVETFHGSIRNQTPQGNAIGIGCVCDNFNQINYSFTTALNALNYRSIHNSNTTIFSDDLKTISTKPISYSPEQENSFLVSLEICNWDEMKFNIETFFSTLKEEPDITFRQVYKLCSEFLFLCERMLRKYESGLENIFKEDITTIDYIASTGSLTDLQQWFSEVMYKIMQHIKIKKSKEVGTIIEDIINYIVDYFFEDIRLNDLADRYHLNKCYLSTVFKDYAGQNFIDMLTKIRMEKAVEFLRENKFKVYEVAQKVGYHDQRYFSKLFKKYYGVSPNRYYKL